MEKILNNKYKLIIILGVVIVLMLLMLFSFMVPDKNASPEKFVVSIGENKIQIMNDLKDKGFIKNTIVFGVTSIFLGTIQPGGYKISKSQNAWQITAILFKKPYMKWVVLKEGLRKEEIVNTLSKILGWEESKKKEWLDYTNLSSNYFEGVFFPDTYLIPIDEAPADIAKRFIAKFEEKFAPYSSKASAQNIKWTTILKIASIVQREAAGKNDMSLIAGIIWNRLDKNMKLDMDSTLQYVRGDTGKGFWVPITIADKKTDSPYNTYIHTGLPPHPISNPGLFAIDSVLNPEKTPCLYYLHDNYRVIHCSNTYENQKQNVEKYLK